MVSSTNKSKGTSEGQLQCLFRFLTTSSMKPLLLESLCRERRHKQQMQENKSTLILCLFTSPDYNCNEHVIKAKLSHLTHKRLIAHTSTDHVTRPFFPPSQIKLKKVVWLHETMKYILVLLNQ